MPYEVLDVATLGLQQLVHEMDNFDVRIAAKLGVGVGALNRLLDGGVELGEEALATDTAHGVTLS